MKNFTRLLESCRTIHSFEPASVTDSQLLDALENSLKAPNHKCTFPWKYILVKGKKKNALADLAVELKSKGKKLSAEKENGVRKKILDPGLVVFCQKILEDESRRKEDYATMSCSVQLFALTLAEEGIGYKWSTGKITRDPKTYELLNLDPSEYEIVGFVLAGRAAGESRPRTRPRLSDVLTREDEL